MRIVSRKINGIRLAISLALPLLAGLAGSVFTAESVSTWYLTLEKPAWNPPSWVFGPVWTTLYVLMGIAFYRVWMATGMDRMEAMEMVDLAPDGTVRIDQRAKARLALAWQGYYAMAAFGIQLVLNVMWSAYFFGLRQPRVAFLVIVALWAGIVVTIALFRRIDRISSALLVPYLAWVSFATTLNYGIWQLNP